MKFKNLGLLGCFIFLLVYCTKNNSNSNPGGGGGGDTLSGDNFKKVMLINYADTLIVPGYHDFQTQLENFSTLANSFLDAPSAATLEATKPAFRSLYLSYERISMPYFGPASSISANTYLNTFPAATQKIESGIATGNYDFTISVVSDSIQGLPTLDYLLYSAGATDKFSGTDSPNRIKYVRDIISRMKDIIDNVRNQWANGYRNTFVSSLKTDVGSSIGLLINQFALEMDMLKGPRIGWPFGKQSNGIVFADKCEAYYSGFSAALTVENLSSLKNYYTGGSGKGIDDYLILLKQDQLNSDVLDQFDIAINALKAIPDPMSDAFTANAQVIEEAYRQVQKLLTLIKTDVASATGVQINYMDNDGD